MQSRATVRPGRVVLALAALVALMGAAQAQEDPRTLEKRLRELAKEATPKTVCVKSYIEQKGDKAGYGTGAIMSEDGYVLTCAHVVDIAKRVEVILHDGTVMKAKILGRNKRQDYALLKVEGKGLSAFKVADSAAVKVGEWVAALGHPGGPYNDLKPAFAFGRVTGLHRRLPVQFFDRFYDDAIQTDVPIFAGNSGGPLVNLKGELVGLNGAILIINENAYAVPMHEIMPNYAALQKGEQIEGVAAKPEDLQALQQQIGPEEMQKLFQRALKNFGKMFGGDGNNENGFGKLFEQFGKMFGGDGEKGEDGAPDMNKMMEELQKQFGGGGGEMPDLSKMLEKLFGGNGKDGAPDMNKLMEQLQKMFSGEGGNGEAPDLQKMLEGFGKMFGGGGGEEDDSDEDKPAPKPRRPAVAPAPAGPSGFVGVKLLQDVERTRRFGGAIVEEAIDGTPAQTAGLKKDDVIVAVDGVATPDPDALRAQVSGKKPGTKTVFTIDRARRVDATVVIERKDITVTIGRRPAEGR